MHKYNIVFATDENYIRHVSVALISLLEKNKDIFVRVNYIIDNVSDLNKSKLVSMVKEYNCELNFILIDGDVFDNSVKNHHFNRAVYFRLLMAEMLPFDKVLYLDADVVVNGSLKSFMDINIENSMIAAVVNPGFYRHKNLRMSQQSDYFNAGVLLVNLEKWREKNIAKRCIDYIDSNKANIEFADQDVLNAIVDGDWIKVPLKYNQQALIFEKNFLKAHNCFDEEELIEARENPVVIHYSGSRKPWHVKSSHPYKKFYWAYLRMTPFHQYMPEDLTVSKIIQSITPASLKKIINSLWK
jgi:lipopolysaccharide biosynthesis glycosyltransferase